MTLVYPMNEVIHYTDAEGRDLVDEWLRGLRDQRAIARILARIECLTLGLFGDCRSVKGGVSELRIDYGPGYRVYFARTGRTLILLLGGGRKNTQRLDVAEAKTRLKEWNLRH